MFLGTLPVLHTGLFPVHIQRGWRRLIVQARRAQLLISTLGLKLKGRVRDQRHWPLPNNDSILKFFLVNMSGTCAKTFFINSEIISKVPKLENGQNNVFNISNTSLTILNTIIAGDWILHTILYVPLAYHHFYHDFFKICTFHNSQMEDKNSTTTGIRLLLWTFFEGLN